MPPTQPTVLALIAEDFRTHREGILAQGFWALLVYRLSHPRLRCRWWLGRKLWAVPVVLGRKAVECLCGISLPEGTSIGRRLNIEHFGGIIVHSAAIIGDDCILRQGVTLGNKSDHVPMAAPRLGNGVEVGAGAKIIGAIVIGDHVRVGANAVVTRDVPAGAVVAGVPARIVRPSSVDTAQRHRDRDDAAAGNDRPRYADLPEDRLKSQKIAEPSHFQNCAPTPDSGASGDGPMESSKRSPQWRKT
jgi:serine O-acetyltransferase